MGLALAIYLVVHVAQDASLPPGHQDSAGAHGEQWTNMIRPFSVLPAPVIAGLQLRGHRVLHDDDAAGPGVALLKKKLIRSL